MGKIKQYYAISRYVEDYRTINLQNSSTNTNASLAIFIKYFFMQLSIIDDYFQTIIYLRLLRLSSKEMSWSFWWERYSRGLSSTTESNLYNTICIIQIVIYNLYNRILIYTSQNSFHIYFLTVSDTEFEALQAGFDKKYHPGPGYDNEKKS